MMSTSSAGWRSSPHPKPPSRVGRKAVFRSRAGSLGQIGSMYKPNESHMATLHSKESSRDHADAVAAAVSVPTSGDHGGIQQFRADTFSQPAEVTDSRHTTKTTQLQLQKRWVIHYRNDAVESEVCEVIEL